MHFVAIAEPIWCIISYIILKQTINKFWKKICVDCPRQSSSKICALSTMQWWTVIHCILMCMVLLMWMWGHPVKASDDGVSVTAWSRPTVLIRRPSSLGWYPVAATSSVRVFAAAQRAVYSSSDCWWPSVRCCWSDALEQSATRHYWLCVTDTILPETENFFVFYIISMTTLLRLVVLEVFT